MRRGRSGRWRWWGIAILFSAAVAPVAAARAQSLPLPEKDRSMVVHSSPFDIPALVLEIYVTTRTRTTEWDMAAHVDRRDPATSRWYTYGQAEVTSVALVNERGPNDPDLAEFALNLEQSDRGEHPLPLELGHRYLVLVEWSARFPWSPKCAQGCVTHVPFYRFAVPQGGFEIQDGRLRVLRRGGPLDAYDGRLLAGVVKELQRPR